MLWVALAIAVSIVALLIGATFVPIRVSLSFKGHGEFGKFWAFAAGAQLGFITVSYADAQGIDSVFQVHVFSRRVIYISPFGSRVVDRIDEHKPTFGELKEKLPRLRDRIERWFDLADLLHFFLDLRRYVRMERFNGRLGYATPDVALTGMLSGGLYTMAGLMSPFGVFHVEPQWVDVAKAEGKLDAAFKFYPLRMLLFAIVFTLKKIKIRQRTSHTPVPAQS